MKIYVVGSSKNKFLPLDNIREKFLIDQKHEGDNIDFLNPWYCELTGLYYLWKHVDDDIVGLEHYRRYFVNNKGNLLSESEIRNAITDCDVLCIKEDYSRRIPNYIISYWDRNRTTIEIQKFLLFIKHFIGEDFCNFCEQYMYGNWHALGNMFIGKKTVINEYCEYIFDLTLNYIEAERNFNREIPRRMIGYFTEFLFGAWLIYNQKKIKFFNVRMIR